MNEIEREKLKRRLLQYPGATGESVELELEGYEQREQEKQALLERGMSNALAEAHLERQGYPRPPGWHSVFFYPDSNRPRNTIVFWFVVIVAVLWFFAEPAT